MTNSETDPTGGGPITASKLNDITVGTTAPTMPTNGQLWFDITNTLLKRYDLSTTSWKVVGAAEVLSTMGDLLYASGANELARLGIGSIGQTLGVASGLPSWRDSWDKVGSGAWSAQTAASLFDVTSIDSAYDEFELVMQGIYSDVDNGNPTPYITLNGDSDTHYFARSVYINNGGTIVHSTQTNQTYFGLPQPDVNAGSEVYFAYLLRIFKPLTSVASVIAGKVVTSSGSAVIKQIEVSGGWANNSAKISRIAMSKASSVIPITGEWALWGRRMNS